MKVFRAAFLCALFFLLIELFLQCPQVFAAEQGPLRPSTKRVRPRVDYRKGVMNPTDFAHIPSIDNATERRSLRCSACEFVIRCIVKRFQTLHTEFHSMLDQVKLFHVVDALDNLCDEEVDRFGLVQPVGSHVVLPLYDDTLIKNESRDIVQGPWIAREWQSVCVEVMEDWESQFLDIFKTMRKVNMCAKACAIHPVRVAGPHPSSSKKNVAKKGSTKQKKSDTKLKAETKSAPLDAPGMEL